MLSVRRVLRADNGGEAHAAFTDRLGGFSAGRYDSFNLGSHVDDTPSAVSTNRAELSHALGLPASGLVFMDQVHGADVAVVTEPGGESPSVDAIVTTRRGIGLVVLVADCTPVLLADAAAGVIAAAHAGRPGMLAGVIPNVLGAMRAAGARSIDAIIGPSICPRHYEVPPEMREQAAAVEPVSASVSATGTPAIDVAAGVAEQLARDGVRIDWQNGCTYERADLYSYRRDGVTGRFGGVLWIP
ncbi:peptidoglycan editing factor PgeF [Spelaeicoccus albus]|uniref:Purine nucleoside phosphorylase n=1 Tax=Spelaeicoccus albus TaxID=1280376 RepID=A0A7Z0D542_9MICO|nr:peptidoglycan editing factor PgeF [Spelaeicoccus albus]NYI68986.1 hypothetical protein [Spelaeicoccus albus]